MFKASNGWKARGLAVAVIAGGFAGCETSYKVDLRNLTDQPADARIFARRVGEKNKLMAEGRLGPGDRRTLGPVYTRLPQPIFLEVDFRGNVGHVLELDLDSGTTVVNVHRREEGSLGTIELEVVPRN